MRIFASSNLESLEDVKYINKAPHPPPMPGLATIHEVWLASLAENRRGN